MDKKTATFTVIDTAGEELVVDEYYDLMASGARGMRHLVLRDDGRKVTDLGGHRYEIDATQEILTSVADKELS